MLTAYFYFELFTQSEDAQILSLLHFPQKPLFPNDSFIKIKRRSAGKNQSFKVGSKNQLMDRLSEDAFNEAEIIYQFRPYYIHEPDGPILIEEICQHLLLSPTSSLWKLTASWPVTNSTFRERMTLKSKEDYLKFHHVDHCPTVLQTVMKINLRASNKNACVGIT